jgi:outer membrane protein assembly factor BamB
MPPEYHDDGLKEKPIVFGSSRGKIMAIDSDTGEQIWRYNCPGGWYNIPVAIVEPPSFEEGRPEQFVYVGAGKWVYCLKAKTGDVVWTTRVSNAKFGLSYMTLATPWSSRLAAEAYSAFSQNPSAQARDWEREQDKNRSS